MVEASKMASSTEVNNDFVIVLILEANKEKIKNKENKEKENKKIKKR